MSGCSVIAEVLEVDEGLREMIGRRASPSEILGHVTSHGFKPMADDAAEKAEWGYLTKEQIAGALYA